ncbi:Bud site selection protein 20 [Komagataella kurtzmanii]|nr:Bud site selection protein 20 [Komagataella kurtzmanii]
MGRYSVRRYKTKRRTRDLDLIYGDLSTPESIQSLKHQPMDEYKAGLGQYYCVHCAKYFQDNKALASHLKSKIHKRRVKDLSVRPYDTLESEAAAGTNLLKFMERVEHYKQSEPSRKQMEDAVLATHLAENEEKDKILAAQLQAPQEEAAQTVKENLDAPVKEVRMAD